MNWPRSTLAAALLWTGSYSAALFLEPWWSSADGGGDRGGSLLMVLLGDGRRLFANHFFAKADAYFHRGVYPSIFDAPLQEVHMVSEATGEEPGHDDAPPAAGTGAAPAPPPGDHAATCTDPTHQHALSGEAGQAPDWIARWNEQLSPAGHEHLAGGDAREMLPWLQLSAELDPHRVQSFAVTAFWLRTSVGKVDEAEAFLRQGLRHNPGNPEILFELGELTFRNRGDVGRARNIWELALQRWQVTEAGKRDADTIFLEQLLGRLALAEEQLGNLPAALRHLETLLPLSPRPDAVQAHVRELQERLKNAAAR